MGEHERVSCQRESSCSAACGSATRCSALLRRARADDGSSSREALSAFCNASWRPVYGLVRGQGYCAADAEDLTQAYFTRFLEKGYMEDVRSWRGCLRPFLWVSVRHFLSNERDRERAAKRGGGRAPLSLDGPGEEGRPFPEPADALTPEVLLERQRADELRTDRQGLGSRTFRGPRDAAAAPPPAGRPPPRGDRLRAIRQAPGRLTHVSLSADPSGPG